MEREPWSSAEGVPLHIQLHTDQCLCDEEMAEARQRTI